MRFIAASDAHTLNGTAAPVADAEHETL